MLLSQGMQSCPDDTVEANSIINFNDLRSFNIKLSLSRRQYTNIWIICQLTVINILTTEVGRVPLYVIVTLHFQLMRVINIIRSIINIQ